MATIWTAPRLEHYDSAEAFVRHVQTLEPSDAHPLRSSLKEQGTDWAPQNWKGTIAAALNGWPDGREKLEKAKALADATLAQATQRRPALAYDVAGFRPHPARAAAGDPLAMVRRGSTTAPRKIVKVYFEASHVHFARADDIARYGAAILAHVDALEHNGTRCEIIGLYDPKGRQAETQELATITIKRPEDPLELDRLSFYFLNAGFGRRLGFRWLEHNPHCPGGYGSTDQTLRHKTLKKPDGVFFPAVTPSENNERAFRTPEDAQLYVAARFVEWHLKQEQQEAA